MFFTQSFLSTLLFMFANIMAIFGNWKVCPQDLPNIACPNIFQYVRSGNNYTGKITIYGALVAAIKVEAQFSQQKPITTSCSDCLRLNESRETVEANLQSGKPITYRVDFPDAQLLPKLTRIRVNDRTICADNELVEPSTIFTLHHTFHTALEALSRPLRPNRLINPFDDGSMLSFKPLKSNATSVAETNSLANCGQVSSNFKSSTLDGYDYEHGRFPWLTAIYINSYVGGLMYACAGSLVSSRTVISVSRCFLSSEATASHIVVYLGRHSLTYAENGVVERHVETVITHPGFEPFSLDADIALLHLKRAVSFTQFIRPICLWSSSVNSSVEVGHVAGWGNKYNNETYMLPVPKVLQVDVASEAECLSALQYRNNFTKTRLLCASERDKNGPCFRLAGAGLMINNNGSWTLRGLVCSFIPDFAIDSHSCSAVKYLLYSDLSKYMAWIHQNMLY